MDKSLQRYVSSQGRNHGFESRMRYQYVQNGASEPDTDQKNARVLPGNIYENLGIRELLMALLDDARKRRFEDQFKTNEQRFAVYDADLLISFQATQRQLNLHRWFTHYPDFTNF